ncbi:Nucleoporin seh1 [Trichinella pseudospiralis]|uniref:Nucleoporin seh1 n=1 Tax=Trichinella pseudospiralis TaxID=6337 RepID=A0A0V1EH68_TRIPS|nr:Nucleoporin seh1 [Trichinella pseudospiralis]
MQNIPIEFNDHSDMIHDVAYNFFGNRFASASSDQTVKVYESTEDGGWAFIADLKAQCGPVFRLDWAHPDFGEMLATCCLDGSIIVWEETASTDDKSTQLTEWVKRTTIAHAKTKLSMVKRATNPNVWNMLEFPCNTLEPVRDLKFAPSCGRSFELLAVACTTIQIYHLTSEFPDDEDKRLCKWNVKLEAELQKAANHTYWRLDWNIIGLELAAVDGAAVLTMWMRTSTGEWELFKRADPNAPDIRKLPGIEEDGESGNSRPASPGDTLQNDFEQSFN